MTRTYSSEVRERRAAQTRRRILDAAREEFLAGGFGKAGIASIARAAGVSSQTVHAHFGTKAALVPALLQELESGADAAGWRERIEHAANGVDRLTAWAGWTVSMLAPSRTLKDICREAAAEPPMADLKQAGDAHRRSALRSLMRRMADAGELRPGLAAEDAADQAWILTGIEVYLAGVDCGWDDDRITTWLAETLVRQLLP